MRVTTYNGKKMIVLEARDIKGLKMAYTPNLPFESAEPIKLLQSISIEATLTFIDPFALALPDGDPKQN
jgi:hypothetical protein